MLLFLLLFGVLVGGYFFLMRGGDEAPGQATGGFKLRPEGTAAVEPEAPEVSPVAAAIDLPAPTASPVDPVAAEVAAPPVEKAASPAAEPEPKKAVVAEAALASPAPVDTRAGVELKFLETLPWLVATLIEVHIDGESVAKAENEKGIGKNLSWTLTKAQIQTGVRKLDVTVKLMGDSDAFPYLAGYTFTMKKSANIPIRGPTVVRLEATPMGNATDDWTKRVNLEFHLDRVAAPGP